MAVPYLQVEGLTKSFGDLVLFEHISFGLNEGQRLGLIAKNGMGKSTLLSIIAGIEGYDEGNIVFRNNLRVGYLEQTPHYSPESTVLEACLDEEGEITKLIRDYEICLETPGNPGLDDLYARMDHANAWDYERKIKQILSKLKIFDYHQRIGEETVRTLIGSFRFAKHIGTM